MMRMGVQQWRDRDTNGDSVYSAQGVLCPMMSSDDAKTYVSN